MAVDRLTDEDYRAKLASAGRAVVCFDARWCGLCMIFARHYERLSEKYPDVDFFCCDGDKEPECRASVPVDALPFFAVYEAGRYLGGFSTTEKDAFEELLDACFDPKGAE